MKRDDFTNMMNKVNVETPVDKHQLHKVETETSKDNIVKDVDHPSHYNQGSIETIEVIEGLGWGEEFCSSNIIKYISRYKHKGNELKDLYKVKWYTERLISYYENSNKK